MKRTNFIIAILALALFALINIALQSAQASEGTVQFANTFLTVNLIAREALIRLRNALVMKMLIHTDYSNEYKKLGDTITVKKPATYIADEFDGTINLQEITESSVQVTLDHIADVSVNWTSKERALNLDDFADQVLTPAMEAIAQKIDTDIHKTVYKDVPYFIGVAGTTPDGLDDFANLRKELFKRGVPGADRRAVWDPDADAKFSILDAIVNAEKSGSTAALREGSIGRIQGLENYMTQNVQTHVAGGYSVLADVTITAGAAGATSIELTSAAGTSIAKLLKGDLFTLDGKQYVVTADTANAVAGVIAAVGIYPALPVAFGDLTDDAVTFADVTAGGHVANLGFHRNAFAFVQRPLEPPMGGAESYTTEFEGISLRVTSGYDMSTKKEIVSIDCLYGIKTLFPELAERVLG